MASRMESLFGSLETSGFIATYLTQRPSADRPLLTGSSYSAGQALRPSTVRRSSVASQNGPEWSTGRRFCGWPPKVEQFLPPLSITKFDPANFVSTSNLGVCRGGQVEERSV